MKTLVQLSVILFSFLFSSIVLANISKCQSADSTSDNIFCKDRQYLIMTDKVDSIDALKTKIHMKKRSQNFICGTAKNPTAYGKWVKWNCMVGGCLYNCIKNK
jgi:hypothetical protein